ncbi:ABC transporter permease [Undibacterium sp. RuRC25W]|uniref:ABC transporter permease n=1 Tax=Undibacterium sp. RuRC25W TaxID=3413047 RepID=UPI003BF2DF5F
MFRLSWRMMMRDWRAGELRFLLVALMIAVASLSSVGFFADRLRSGLQRDAHQLLGADLLVSADQPINPEWRSEAQKRGLQIADTVVFSSMGLAGEGDHGLAKLVSLKAVSPHYPLRGKLKLNQSVSGSGETANREVEANDIPAPGTVWIDPALQVALNLKLGDQVRLGDLSFIFTHTIADEPDRGAGFMNFAPRAMIAASDLSATNLIQNGSRVTYRLLMAGPVKAVASFQNQLQAQIEQNKLKGVRLESLESGRPEMRATLDRSEQFLSLVSLLSALLAAVAIAMAARRFMLRHLDACAMLRCLGLTQNQVTMMYLVEFFILGLLGSTAGVVLGYASHYVLLEWLGSLLAKDLPAASWMPAVHGVATGLLLLVGFALPPVLQLRNVPHNRVMRREQDPPQATTIATYVLGLVMFVGLLLWQTGDVKLGLITAGSFLVGIAVFALIAWLGVASLKQMRNFSQVTAWRFAITALQRRPGATVIQIVALALGLMALLLLTVVRGDLISAWKQSTPADAPNQFVINIQPDQIEEITARLAQFEHPRMYPMIRGRLIAVNAHSVTPDSYEEDQAKRMVDREFNLSAMNDIPTLNKITAGQWFDDRRAIEPEASVEVGIAKTLKLKLGDKLTFDVAGQQVVARVTSLRKLDWGSMRVNFFVVLNPKAIVDLPATWITAFRLPVNDQRFVNQLTLDFPNLTVVDVGAIIKQLQTVLDQVITAVEFLFLFTLASGVLVLYAALAGSQDVRQKEAALLRALGATRKQLSYSQWIEFLLIGSVAGLLAASGATAVGWALARFSFNFEWTFSPLVWVAGIAIGAVCALFGGWVGLRNILNQPPLLSLRDS